MPNKYKESTQNQNHVLNEVEEERARAAKLEMLLRRSATEIRTLQDEIRIHQQHEQQTVPFRKLRALVQGSEKADDVRFRQFLNRQPQPHRQTRPSRLSGRGGPAQ